MNTSEFQLNLAVVIGINNYQNGVPTLGTARQDAEAVADILTTEYQYQVHLITDKTTPQATSKTLQDYLETELPEILKKVNPSRLLFYFAGHGIALNGDDGPQGYLIPQDAKLGEVSTYLPMQQVEAALTKLACRHCLVILDCCFAGAFRWSSTRKLVPITKTIYKERYDRFIQDPAWQVITSAASDQYANDSLDIKGDRGVAKTNIKHSPFAAALMDALSGKADAYPPSANGKPSGDGVITATELYLYLRDAVEPATEEQSQRQTPGIWPLKNHDKGEYIFRIPGHPLNLPSAPPLNEKQNPYRGLESFEEEHSAFFFGRTASIEKLYEFVCSHTLTIVLGASGSGKSSLVKAGLVPYLKQQLDVKAHPQWQILAPFRPGESPLKTLNPILSREKLAGESTTQFGIEEKVTSLSRHLADWSQQHPNQIMLLVIDQFEELITLCKDELEREQFLALLADAVAKYPKQLRLVLTLRSDFEPQFRDIVFKQDWNDSRFVVSQMTRADLREAIEKPAEKRVMYFEPHELVEQLIDEVADMPGMLPLLSFGLSELYLKYLRRQQDAQNSGRTIDRALTQADYQSIGGVIQSLTQRADEEYERLVKENPAYAQVIRQVMLRMVAIGGGELARRQVLLSELEYPSAKNSLVREAIERFRKARLLVKDENTEGQPYVEPAHDALVRGWQKLLAWKQEDEESLILQRRLTPAAEEWKKQKEVKFLWNANPRLDLLKKILCSEVNWFNAVEAEFVQRSVGRKNFNIRKNWSIAIAVMLGLGSGLLFSLIGQRSALIGQISATRQSAESNLPNQELNAMLDSLRAEKSLKDWPGYLSVLQPESNLPFLKSDSTLQRQVLQTLRKVFYVAKERHRIEVPQGYIKTIFAPDGTLLVATAHKGIVHLPDPRGKERPKVFSGNIGAVGLDVSQDGRFLATIDEQGTVRLWNFRGEQEEPPKFEITIPQSSSSFSRVISFSPDSKKLVAHVDNHVVYLWSLSGNELRLLKKAQGNFNSISFNHKNQLVVGTKLSDTLLLSNFESGRQLAKFKDFKGSFFKDLVFSPDGQYLAAFYGADVSGAYFGRLDNESWNNLQPISRASSISFDASNNLIIGQEGNGIISVYNSNSVSRYRNDISKALKLELKGHQGSIREIVVSLNGKYISSKANDNTIRLWATENKPVPELRQIPNLTSISISPNGKQLAAIKDDGTVRLLDLNANELKLFANIKDKVSQLVFDPDGQRLAAVSKDNTICLLDLNGRELYRSRKFERQISQLIFRPNSKQLAVVEDDGTIHLLTLNNKSWEILPNKVAPNSGDGISRIAFNSDDRLLEVYSGYSSADRGNISLNQLGNGTRKEIVKFTGSRKTFDSISLNAQHDLFVSADSGHIQVWDISGKLLTTFKDLHQGEVTSISLSADGNLMTTLGKDGTAKLWQIGGRDQLLEQGCAWVSDYLATLDQKNSDRYLCEGIKLSQLPN